MKKHLLTLVLITLVSLTANAQTVYESLKGQPVHVVSGNGTIDHSLSATQTSVAAPMCKAEGEGGTQVPFGVSLRQWRRCSLWRRRLPRSSWL